MPDTSEQIPTIVKVLVSKFKKYFGFWNWKERKIEINNIHFPIIIFRLEK